MWNSPATADILKLDLLESAKSEAEMSLYANCVGVSPSKI